MAPGDEEPDGILALVEFWEHKLGRPLTKIEHVLVRVIFYTIILVAVLALVIAIRFLNER